MTVLGPVSFDDQGNADVPAFTLWQWREGLVWPLGEGPDRLR